MRQPELGKKITSLRNEKGLTQEELVEKCNISVRTIQRIEAGEVTPRSYTVKTILAALDYNLEKIKEDFSAKDNAHFDLPANAYKKVSWAFYVGILYFLIGFVEFYLDADLAFTETLSISSSFYISVKLISLVSMLFFYNGFAVSGAIFNNYLLQTSSILLMIVFGISVGYDIYCLYSPNESEEYFAIIFSIVTGCAMLLNGIGILRLKKYLGTNLTAVTAILVIFTGITLITVFLFILGLFALIPVTILQLILLYRIREFITNV